MAYKVVMPKAGMAMETGVVSKWLKAVGDTVEKGEPLLSIETDKTTMEVESMYDGVLLKIVAEEGDEVPVVQTIAYIGKPGEKIPDEDAVSGVAQTEPKAVDKPKAMQAEAPAEKRLHENGKIAATPAARRIAAENNIDLASVTPSGSLGQIKAADIPTGSAAATKVTPLARSIAKDKGIPLDSLKGSGYNNKITKKDVLRAEGKDGGKLFENEQVPHSAMRKVIARRMLQSHLDIPPVTQNCLADVTELTALRARINEGLEREERVTLNDFVMMAVARALLEHPYVNASYTPEGMLLKKHINIGVAVALEEGLIVPVIKDADILTLREISASVRKLAQKAKQGELSPDEYSDGTFTISNLGMMRVTAFTPIINQPESAILGVCAIEQRLEMDDDGTIRKALKMPLCLTYDHRSIDGAQAALFSNTIVTLLENPLKLLI